MTESAHIQVTSDEPSATEPVVDEPTLATPTLDPAPTPVTELTAEPTSGPAAKPTPEPAAEPAPEPEPEPEPAAAASEPEATLAFADALPLPPPVPIPAPDPTLMPAPTLVPVPAPIPVPDPEAAARKARRRRNALRWTGAVVLTLAVGGGIAFGIAAPQRDSIPGLGTPSDGRYVFPALTMPALPTGVVAPANNADNPGSHLTDIRRLLLPLPQGATRDTSLPGTTGWVSAADAAALFNTTNLSALLAQYGLRHTAGEAWSTASDGATTKIYLLQFIDQSSANSVFTEIQQNVAAVPTSITSTVLNLPDKSVGESFTVRAGTKLSRYALYGAGDTIVLIAQSGPSSLPVVPFNQVAMLQDELLE